MRRWPAIMAAVTGALAAAGPAAAGLGGMPPTVEADRIHLAATMTHAAAPAHTVHTLTLANGGTVREFEDGDGMVFALAWDGPSRPDLRQLLGSAFTTFQTDVAVARRGPRQALTVRRDDLVVRSAGHPGAFRGFAYLPHRLPAGFTADALD